jgi:hypothetical protein
MTARHRGIIIVIAVVAAAALAATAAATLVPQGGTDAKSPAPATPQGGGGTVDARGRVTSVSTAAPGGDVLGSFLVEGPKDPSLVCDKASLTVTIDTRFYRRTPDGDVPLNAVSMALLEPGMQVEVTITGPVAESYPVQATAATVTIVE